MDKISVIIPVCNGSEFFDNCLQSIFNSTYRNLEVIVVNDGSTDQFDDAIRDYKPDITVVSTKSGKSAAARNCGLRRSTGEFVSFFDVDDINGKMRLELSVKKFESEPHSGMVFCGTTFIDDQGGFLTGVGKFPDFDQSQFLGRMYERNWINTISTTLMRRNVLERVGGFDESFDIGEDYDLYLRIGSISKVEYIDLPLVRYRIHSKDHSNRVRDLHEYEIKALRKFDPGEVAANLSALFTDEKDFRLSFGKILYKMGQVKDALRQFKRALLISSGSADAFFFTGNCYYDLGDYKESLIYFKDCLKIDPGHAGCRNNIGILYFHQGDYDRSINEFKRAVKLGSNQVEPRHNLSCVKKEGSGDLLRLSLYDSQAADIAGLKSARNANVKQSISL
ncbi:glycosyltransferase [candidate division KSB1 bacterium]